MNYPLHVTNISEGSPLLRSRWASRISPGEDNARQVTELACNTETTNSSVRAVFTLLSKVFLIWSGIAFVELYDWWKILAHPV